MFLCNFESEVLNDVIALLPRTRLCPYSPIPILAEGSRSLVDYLTAASLLLLLFELIIFCHELLLLVTNSRKGAMILRTR
jgi:hypothetical protein